MPKAIINKSITEEEEIKEIEESGGWEYCGIIAREQGYHFGEFRFDKESKTWRAPLTRIQTIQPDEIIKEVDAATSEKWE